MSFSCTIKIKNKDVTKFDTGPINCQLLGLAPNTNEDTPAPYRLDDIRAVVANRDLKDEAILRRVQAMLKRNLESLEGEKHCETCNCNIKVTPKHWDIDQIKYFLSINPEDVTHIDGGW